MQKKRCELCGRQEGIIEIQVYRDNKPKMLSLCTSCAMKLLENHPEGKDDISALLEKGGEEMFQMIFEVRSLLGEIVSQIHTIETQRARTSQVQCSCGLTYEEFKETGYLGCPWCYDTFKTAIHEMLVDIERGTVHRGMIPPKHVYFLLVQKEIAYLQRRLKHLISREAYEEAARVQKRLRRIQGKTQWDNL